MVWKPGWIRVNMELEYNTRKRKSVKNEEGLVSFITCVTSGGRENDVRGRGRYSNMYN